MKKQKKRRKKKLSDLQQLSARTINMVCAGENTSRDTSEEPEKPQGNLTVDGMTTGRFVRRLNKVEGKYIHEQQLN